jgi:hypothetical protein
VAKKAKTSAKKPTKKTSESGDRRDWTDADLKIMKTLVKQNTPTRLIAMKLKRTVTSVYGKAGREGISLAPTNRSPRD